MDLDTMLIGYFGTADLDMADPATLAAGRDRLLIALGTERDAGRRFALWTMLAATGDAPDPAATFKDPRDVRAAADLMRATRPPSDL